jgi:hypothetical protein
MPSVSDTPEEHGVSDSAPVCSLSPGRFFPPARCPFIAPRSTPLLPRPVSAEEVAYGSLNSFRLSAPVSFTVAGAFAGRRFKLELQLIESMVTDGIDLAKIQAVSHAARCLEVLDVLQVTARER